jgi:hypothetical protein
MGKFVVEKRTRSASRQMILDMAWHGNHGQEFAIHSEQPIRQFYSANSLDFDALVEACREPNRQVPHFENLFQGMVYPGSGATVSIANMSTGEESATVRGPGAIAKEYYWPQFERAASTFDQSLRTGSFMDFHTALVWGVSSLQSYLAYVAELWNRLKPEDMLVDSAGNKVSFEDKINVWIPKMTNGKHLDKSQRSWNDFRALKEVRDNEVIHLKSGAYSISQEELVTLMNRFSTGIAQLLFQLHMLFSTRVPTRIIRIMHFPTIRYESMPEVGTVSDPGQ